VEITTDDAEPTRLNAWIYRPEGPGPARVLRLDPRRPPSQPSERPVLVIEETTTDAGASAAESSEALRPLLDDKAVGRDDTGGEETDDEETRRPKPQAP
ncbi:MAG: hypothetical protein AAFY88_18895, partial [Acidobacteriota bacterium]